MKSKILLTLATLAVSKMSFGIIQVVDQSQLIVNGTTSARSILEESVWQSFTAGNTGTLIQIDLGFFTEFSGDGTLEIFQGEGTTGSLLQSTGVTVESFDSPTPTMNSFTTNVSIVSGNQYTFNFIPNTITIPDPYGVAIANPGPYSGGALGINSSSGTTLTNFDAVFETTVEIVPEPAHITAILGGVVLLLVIKRRRTYCSQRL